MHVRILTDTAQNRQACLISRLKHMHISYTLMINFDCYTGENTTLSVHIPGPHFGDTMMNSSLN